MAKLWLILLVDCLFFRQYKLAVTVIWIIALTINLPWLYVFRLEPMENGSSRKVPYYDQCSAGQEPLFGHLFRSHS